MQLSTISPAPSACTSATQSSVRRGSGLRSRRVAGVAAHAPLAVCVAQAVHADHHALHAEGLGQFGHECRALQRGRVDRDLVGPRAQHAARLFDRADPAGDAERDVDDAGDALHPVRVDTTPLGAGADVVEHEFVRAGVAVARGEFLDRANDDVVAESARP
jgi:hypothetical protein